MCNSSTHSIERIKIAIYRLRFQRLIECEYGVGVRIPIMRVLVKNCDRFSRLDELCAGAVKHGNLRIVELQARRTHPSQS